MNETILKIALRAAELALKFGRVDRVTRHEDGIRSETDTDHTVMLGILGVAFAQRFQPDLNLGLIALFSLVHDLPEAHAGDTNTSGRLTEEEKKKKFDREYNAWLQIQCDFGGTLPWIGRTIADYDSQSCREARYVRAFDKILPKLTHILNGCVVVKSMDYDLYHVEQRKLMQELVGDMPWLMELWESSVDMVRMMATDPTGLGEEPKA
jgi:5'-deoxynucleotidase YfbR-like HD superfamily hydrolase